MAAGHLFRFDVSCKDRFVCYGDCYVIAEHVTEQRMFFSGPEKLFIEDFIFGKEPELITESLFEYRRKFFFVFILYEKAQCARFDRRQAHKAFKYHGIVHYAAVNARSLTVIGGDEKKGV